jgi:hypothetical protein
MNLMQHLFSFTNKEKPVAHSTQAPTQRKLPPPHKAKSNSNGCAPKQAVTTPKLSTPTTITTQITTPRQIVYPYKPKLTFSPYTWAKMLFMRDKTDNEVGAFGITSVDNLLYVYDLVLVKQEVTGASVSFDDEGVADFFDAQVKLGRRPSEFARVWIHTHPGNCAQPSMTDYETLHRVFGVTDWSVMFILAQGGDTSCELRFNIGPKASMDIPISIDYLRSFDGTDFGAWKQEYEQNVNIKHTYTYTHTPKNSFSKFDYNSKASTIFKNNKDDEDDMAMWWQGADHAEIADIAEFEDFSLLKNSDEDAETVMATCSLCGEQEEIDYMLQCPKCEDAKYCFICCENQLDHQDGNYICLVCGTKMDFDIDSCAVIASERY